jgi:hypothetical protein
LIRLIISLILNCLFVSEAEVCCLEGSLKGLLFKIESVKDFREVALRKAFSAQDIGLSESSQSLMK